MSNQEAIAEGDEPHSPGTSDNGIDALTNNRNASALHGQVGLTHITSAELGKAGVLRLGVKGEYFRSSSFPVLGAANTRTAGTLSLGYTFTDWLQAYGSYSVLANTNSRSSPRLIQTQGDLRVGLTGSYEVTNGLSLGIDARLLVLPSIGNQDVTRGQLGFAPTAVVTWDARSANPSVPLRLHLNAGGIFDKAKSLGAGQALTAAEEFALDAQRFNRVALGVGVEVPLPIVTAYVEYGNEIPVGAGTLTAPDNSTVTLGRAMAQQLGLGLRLTAIRDLTVDVGADFGLARTVAYGIPATMPWNVLFGLSYAIDPSGGTRTRTVEKTFERTVTVTDTVAAAPQTGRVEGMVVDAQTGKPLDGALVTLAGSLLPPVATDASRGRFVSYELGAGNIRLEVSRPGYHPVAVDTRVEAGKSTAVEVRLVAKAEPATLEVKLTSKGKPVTGTVALSGSAPSSFAVTGEGTTQVPGGFYGLTVSADGYEAVNRDIDLAAGQKSHLDFDLVATKPEAPVKGQKQLVLIVKDRIVIKQQVQFATNKSAILKPSFGLLDQVAEAIKSNNLKKVNIDGHTDNVGDKAVNQKLSDDRAASVKAYLVKKGIPADHLVARGFGDTKPLLPNLTPKGRDANRRVEFTIVER